MKSINLTKEQKEKLLKMCNALFPEYDSIYYIKNQRLQFIEKDNIPEQLKCDKFVCIILN